MHCPKCGQEQASEETRFCSRCGFLLSGIARVVANDGAIPASVTPPVWKGSSPRRRGVLQGLFFFLLSFLIIPLIVMITIASNSEPYAVVIAAVIFTMGGMLRAAYALMFESPYPKGHLPAAPSEGSEPNVLTDTSTKGSLPSATSIPVSAYQKPQTGLWRDTNDLQKEPSSVTDGTTQLLENDQ
jgi:hypothetical protein